MNSKLVRGLHISKLTFRGLLRLFSVDLSAPQVASLNCLSRNTVH